MEGKLDYFHSKHSLSSKNLQRSDFTEENLTCFIYIVLLYINRLFQGFLKQDFEPNHNRNTSRTSAMAETTSNHFGANECSFILIGLYGTPISPRASRAPYGAISLEQAIMYATWKIPFVNSQPVPALCDINQGFPSNYQRPTQKSGMKCSYPMKAFLSANLHSDLNKHKVITQAPGMKTRSRFMIYRGLMFCFKCLKLRLPIV